MKYIKNFNEGENTEFDSSKYLPMLNLISNLINMLDDKELNLDKNCALFSIIRCVFIELYYMSTNLSILGNYIKMKQSFIPSHNLISNFNPKLLVDDLTSINRSFSKIEGANSKMVRYINRSNKMKNLKIHFYEFLNRLEAVYKKIKNIDAFKFTSIDIEDFLLEYIDYGNIKNFNCYTFYDFEKTIKLPGKRNYYTISREEETVLIDYKKIFTDIGKILPYYHVQFFFYEMDINKRNKIKNDIHKRIEYRFEILAYENSSNDILYILNDK